MAAGDSHLLISHQPLSKRIEASMYTMSTIKWHALAYSVEQWYRAWARRVDCATTADVDGAMIAKILATGKIKNRIERKTSGSYRCSSRCDTTDRILMPEITRLMINGQSGVYVSRYNYLSVNTQWATRCVCLAIWPNRQSHVVSRRLGSTMHGQPKSDFVSAAATIGSYVITDSVLVPEITWSD